ncbi:MAG: hypothetical protein ACD_75C01708G0003 [uncultured bacterium]|nr:MAG: hypothetical protein ACD_75C01708G0003 [uncultured bacterium]
MPEMDSAIWLEVARARSTLFLLALLAFFCSTGIMSTTTG